MKTSVLILAVCLTACSWTDKHNYGTVSTQPTGPPATSLAERTSYLCNSPAIYDCSEGYPRERLTGPTVSPCDPSVTNPVIYVECPTRKAEADAAMLRRSQQDAANNAMASRYQADALYCKMQAQVASSNVRGFLYPAAVYGQVENTCLQMKAAERGTSNY